MTCGFQQRGILTSVDSDEPAQPPFKLETPNNVRTVEGLDGGSGIHYSLKI